MKASLYLGTVKRTGQALRRLYAQKIGAGASYWKALDTGDINCSEANRLEKRAENIFYTGIFLLVVSAMLTLGGLVLGGSGIRSDAEFGSWCSRLLCLVFPLSLVCFCIARLIDKRHDELMEDTDQLAAFAKLVESLTELGTEGWQIIIADCTDTELASLAEKHLAKFAGTVSELEDGKAKVGDQEEARGKFHLLHDTLAELGFLLRKKKMYFPAPVAS